MSVRITASQIGAILGVNPSRTRDSVLRDMVRKHHGAESEYDADNAVTQHGKLHETAALMAFMRATDLDVEKCGFIPFGDLLGAIPDGIVEDDAVLEIKAPYGLRNRQKAEFKPISETAFHQIQMEMLAAGKEKGYFVQYVAAKGDPFQDDYVPEQIDIQLIQSDDQWLPSIEKDLNRFYDLFKSEIDNPEHLQPLRKVIDGEQAQLIIDEVMSLRERQKADKEREAALIKDIIQLAGEEDSDVCGHLLTKVEKKGNVNYNKLLQENNVNVDVDGYRGKGSIYWKLT